MGAIFKRELNAYFLSSIGYIFLAAFYFFSGYFFINFSIAQNRADLKYLFSNLIVVLIFLIPVLTMKIMSEDKRNKTDQLLLTAPIKISSIIMGKFFASLVVVGFAFLITFVYAIILSFLADFDWTIFIATFLGFILMSSTLVSIGIFISSLTENQVISAVASFAVMLILFFMDGISSSINNQFISTILGHLSIVKSYQQFTYGIITIPNVLLFITFISVFLFLTCRVVEKRRWSN